MGSPHHEFALSLHGGLPGGGNFVWSPYSVASALGVASAGARGRTYEELAAALAPGGDLGDLGRELARAARLDHAEIAVANDLWTQSGLGFRAEFQKAVLGWPGGALHDADLGGDPEGSRREINRQVEETTRSLIKDLIPAGSITAETVAVIVNAIYLKVAWLRPFGRNATAPAAFRAPSGTRQVPTMRQAERMGHAAGHGWRLATLGTGSEVLVDVLLPDGDLAEAERGLTADVLGALYSASSHVKLDLALPRFRIEGEAVLNGALRALGVEAAFGRDADFSGITADGGLWIDQAIHKAVLDVDEEGFEGAAATALVMRAVAFVPEDDPVPFVVDRPFLVIVRHAVTGAVYFMARVVEP
ncbi:serpin family protein [Spirillospora sp. NPDC047279]|uniref:serpin family protein n=1 Tax=Spirillospora sp. NPDC047279 TaxID=3155478 RepID=UPI0033C3566B